MKKLKMTIVIIVAVSLFSIIWIYGNSFASSSDTGNLPITHMKGSFVYDVDDKSQAVGICDYVFVGKVLSNDGTHYENIVMMEDDNARSKESGAPYTDYTIEVLDNIKGNLQKDAPIKIVKHGGVVQDKTAVFVFQNDELPIVDAIYIFLGYAQADGSILISGPNSNVVVKTAEKTRGITVKETKEYTAYRNAVENEIIPIKRERFSSIYEYKKAR